MTTARKLIPHFDWTRHSAADSVTLDHDHRHRRRLMLASDGGIAFLLDLPKAVLMRDGDALELDDGRLLAVRAADEPLMRVDAGMAVGLARLAWHIGNRHLPAMIAADHILLRRDHVIAAMLEGLGAQVREVMAPFTPEQGAYAGQEHGHDHSHGHGHDRHDHYHHQHDHNHAH